MPSNLVICYDGIQRTYRNALVRHVRSRLKVSYPANWSEKLRKPFEKEWDKLIASATERRRTGEIACEIVDDFDLLGVNHFFNLFDVYYDDLCDCPSGTDEAQKKKEKQAILQWLKTTKNLRDPLSHPSDEDFSYEDSFILLDCARRVLVRLGFQVEAETIRQLTTTLSGSPHSIRTDVEPLEDRLPPRESIVVDFVGRKRELETLRNWFSDPVSRRWALAGEGGKGKSALAYKFATDVKLVAPRPFQIVLWLSAKKKQFREGQVTEIREPDFTNLATALTRLLSYYGWADEAGQGEESKKVRCLELLDVFPALIVVDDIDSLEGEDEDAVEFFADHVPNKTKSKVLFTSRRTLFGMGNSTTHVGGFSQGDAEKFVASRCRLMGLETNFLTASQVKEIVQVTESSPLYIEDLIRLLTIIPPRDALKVWKEKAGDEARRYALGRELDQLSTQAKQVLLAACVSQHPVSLAEIEALTGLSEESIVSAVGSLQRLFLFPKPRLIEGEQRFEVNLNTRALVVKVMQPSDVYRRIVAAEKAVSGDIRLARKSRSEVAAIIRQAVFHVRNQDMLAAESLLSSALEKYVNDPDLTGFLGWIYKAWEPPRVTDAREKFKRAYQLKCPNEEMYEHWCRMELREQEWTKAAEAAECGLKLMQDSYTLMYWAGYSRGRLAKDLLSGLHHDRAHEEARKSITHLKKALRPPELLESGKRGLNADVYRALVLSSEILGDLVAMKTYFESWLAEHPEDWNAKSEWDRLARKFPELRFDAEV
ncbi:MAG TPA: ATP-binding protein [Bryobacteraceae bacterium]|nr:ATP-binding protein [Bryobacteraceae bacterium]